MPRDWLILIHSQQKEGEQFFLLTVDGSSPPLKLGDTPDHKRVPCLLGSPKMLGEALG